MPSLVVAGKVQDQIQDMKSIEEIKNMKPEQLEEAALEENIHIPEGLEKNIMSAIAAHEILKEYGPVTRMQWAPYLAFAVVAAIAVAVVIPRIGKPALRDTFDDPYLAYAQVEATFQKISDKMTNGVNLASKAGETAETSIQIIKHITE